MTSVMQDGVELEGTRVIGKALVYDPAAVIALPANTKVLEPAVMTNTDARFVIVPANVQRIESGWKPCSRVPLTSIRSARSTR